MVYLCMFTTQRLYNLTTMRAWLCTSLCIHYICAGICLLDIVLLCCTGIKVASISNSADNAPTLKPLRSVATSLATSDSSTSSSNCSSNNDSNNSSTTDTGSATKRRNSINAQSTGAAVTADCSHSGYQHMSSSSSSSNYNSNSNDVNYDTIDLESPATWERLVIV